MKQMNCTDTMPTSLPNLENAGWRLLRRFYPALADAAISQFAAMCEWQRRSEMRHRMQRLDDHMLDDIGLTREQVEAEVRKPFWKA